jgi:asparagine synthase (glutamine-hydrolysing)
MDFMASLNAVQQMQACDFLTYLTDDILTKVDRASMAVSLESREPLLDHRLIHMAWQAPTSFLLDQSRTKKPLQDILGQYVPRQLFERPKMGFGLPLGDWLRGDLRSWAQDLLSADRLNRQGIVNTPVIQKKWQDHLSGRVDMSIPLWTVLMFQSWLEGEDQGSLDLMEKSRQSCG